MAAFALNVNVVLVANSENDNVSSSSAVQVVAAVISLGVLTMVSLWCLFQLKTPNYTIPSVAIWTTFWIFVGLHNPKELILDTFSESEINGFCYGAIGLFFALIYCCILKLFTS